MFLSRIELRPDAARNPGLWEQVASGYGVHEMIWSWFADSSDRRRDFLYRVEEAGARARFYALSERRPQDPIGVWQIESKPFAPKLHEGDQLLFSVRANPTRRRVYGPGEGHRHDVIMDAKVRLRAKGIEPRPEAELVQSEGFAWLASRADSHGFEVQAEHVRVDGYRQVVFRRGNGREMRLSTVEIEGSLMVRDTDLFTHTLRSGLGPAKGFGCGLMLVKRG